MAASNLNLSGEEMYSDGDGDSQNDTSEAAENFLPRGKGPVPVMRDPLNHARETTPYFRQQRQGSVTADYPIPIPRSRNKDRQENSPTPQPPSRHTNPSTPNGTILNEHILQHGLTSQNSEKLIVSSFEKTRRIEHSITPHHLLGWKELYQMFTVLICIVILQTISICYILSENSHRMNSLEAKHKEMASEVFESIAEIKSVIQGHLKSLRNQNSLDFQEVRQSIKKLYTQNSQNAEGYSENPPSYPIMEEPKAKTNSILRSKVPQFRNSMEALKRDARTQFEETWIELFAGIVRTMDASDSSRPGAVLLLVPPTMNYEGFATCFTKKLANIVNSAHGLGNAPLKEITREYLQDFPTLTDIHDDLEEYLKNIGKSVVVYEPDKITREDHLMIFHSFCDNFMANNKAATFFFLMKIPATVVEEKTWSPLSGPKFSRQLLHKAWENVMSYDKRAALIARIAVNVISLRDGDSCN